MAIDFKSTLDLAGNTMPVLNLFDHGRRVLHWSRATDHPTAEWVAQQLRNAFMDLDDLPEALVMDRDSVFCRSSNRRCQPWGSRRSGLLQDATQVGTAEMARRPSLQLPLGSVVLG
jgi:hypothetical protein